MVDLVMMCLNVLRWVAIGLAVAVVGMSVSIIVILLAYWLGLWREDGSI